MSNAEGTTATGVQVAELTNDELLVMDAALVTFLGDAEATTEALVTEGIKLVDGCLSNPVYKVAKDANGQPFADGPSYVLARIAAAPNFGRAIAYPIAERLLLMKGADGKPVQGADGKPAFTVRKVEAATGVSRGVLNTFNQKAKRKAQPQDGSKESDERIAAKNAAKRNENTCTAVMDAAMDMTSEERVKVAKELAEALAVVRKCEATYKAALKTAADKAKQSPKPQAPKPQAPSKVAV